MGKPILKLSHEGRDFYLIWSTIADAPITRGMTLDELRAYTQAEYGREGMRRLPDQLEQADEKFADDLISCNRAGENEEELTKEQIIEMYCLARPRSPEVEPKRTPLPGGDWELLVWPDGKRDVQLTEQGVAKARAGYGPKLDDHATACLLGLEEPNEAPA